MRTHPSPSLNHTGKHVLIVSSSGGIGRTSVAMGLAEFLPRVRPDLRVALVDAVLDGQVASGLGIAEHTHTLDDLTLQVRDEGQLTAKTLDRYLYRTEWGFSVLAAARGDLHRPGLVLHPESYAAVYDGLQALFDITLTDTPVHLRSDEARFLQALFKPERMKSLVILLLLGPRRSERNHFDQMVGYLRSRDALKCTWLVYIQTRPYRTSSDGKLVRSLEDIAADKGLCGIAGRLPYDLVIEDALETFEGRAHQPLWSPALARQHGHPLGESPIQKAMRQLALQLVKITGRDDA